VTEAGPHPVSPARLAEARTHPDPRLAALPAPRMTIRLAPSDRRSSPARRRAASASEKRPCRLSPPTRGGFVWDGSGENPYLAMLALADTIVATGDSANMHRQVGILAAAVPDEPAAAADEIGERRAQGGGRASAAAAGSSGTAAARIPTWRCWRSPTRSWRRVIR
jgi:hypothetical protein